MTAIYFNVLSGLLSADPGSGGVTLSSAQFAAMPVVAAPNTMRLTLDPDGASGFGPEIVTVTAHAAAATTCTVTRGNEVGFGGVAGRSHAVNTVWRHSLTHADMEEMREPAGRISTTIAATPDAGCLFIDGSTVVGAQTTYPTTWGRIPASWKSGANMVLPDWRGRVLVMDDAGAALTLGATGGAATVTIAQANLPAVGVTVDPPNTAVTGSTGTESVPHTHVYQRDPGIGSAWVATVNPGLGSLAAIFEPLADHATLAESAPHSHPAGTLAVDIAPFASGNLGSGTALPLPLPPCAVVQYQLKCH